jgi:uncharacterized protein YndB with AHSA1/START domain
MSRSVIVEETLAHPAEKIWRALTQGPLLEDWLMANDFEPVVGRRFTFRAPPAPQWNGIVEGEVLVVEPQVRLAYGWNTGGEGGAGGLRTVVTWTLTPIEGGVVVRMEQSGFGPDDTRNAAGATYGWRRNFRELERVLGGLS